MFLKSELFEFNGANATLYELSALQRVELLHYLAAQEKALPNDEPDEQILSAALVELNIRAGAMVVAMSLWHSESPKPDIRDLQQQVMSTWPVEAIGKADTQVKVLSGMMANLQTTEQEVPESEDTDSAGETAEKR
ncbi:phage minor tail protein G (plasmid) [Rahnella aquatilis]|jgi:phage minor tail protein G|uniref:Phage tail assembly chaperone G n=1 Tax=Rahnella sp. (strain Y9602) TaxID=2703885 RepID=A0ABW6CCD0_RAHSY|nr:phage minor tail protein G [Rahnella aceris]AFE58006.1 phage minor tail protein G [Rahnella aquatilis HX2]QEU50507.1 phage minor tail protein G [Rahnella aquatilis]QEU51533.1 phage minor tail protein G [Rahnella aquatilis]UNK55627.1 phage minor tail protein G [Rahnella aceris]